MSKLTQIQAALKSVSPAVFQQLADSLLRASGFENIHSVGSVAGRDKTRIGTPDALSLSGSGRYTFFEHTTQESGIVEKFLQDLEKCFDEPRTGIPATQIDRVVLCCNSDLRPADLEVLRNVGRAKDVAVDVRTLHSISHDLYQAFPRLARDFLGVEVDTGQIHSLDDFVAIQSRRPLATSLATAFLFRTDEVEQVVGALQRGELVLLTGKPGTGKTRLAVESARRFFDVTPGCRVHAIVNRGADLFEDLRTYLAPEGTHLVLVDDANRVSGFSYLLELLLDHSARRQIRVIATVRDYAASVVLEQARARSAASTITLERLSDDQIKELMQGLGILNSRYLDHIALVAGGNPRLAMMIGSLAVRENTLQSIADVSTLYEEYFGTVGREVGLLGKDRLPLRVAGLVAFFRVVDRSQSESFSQFCEIAQASPADTWAVATRLHEGEILDMWEHEVVKGTDQVLSTYLLHKALFGESPVLAFGDLLLRYFPRLRHRFIDALNPMFTAYDARALTTAIRPHVTAAWHALSQAGDGDGLLSLAQTFHFAIPTRALRLVRDRVSDAGGTSEVDESALASYSDAQVSAEMGLLVSLARGGTEDRDAAIDILLTHALNDRASAPQALRALVDGLGFDHESVSGGLTLQNAVVDALIRRARRTHADDTLLDRMLLELCGAWLGTHRSTHEMRGDSVLIRDFDLPDTDSMRALRRTLWKHLLMLLDTYPNQVLAQLERLAERRFSPRGRTALAGSDLDAVEEVLNTTKLETGHYRTCRAFRSLFQRLALDAGKVPRYPIQQLGDHPVLRVHDLLTPPVHERRAAESFEAFETAVEERLLSVTAQLDADQWTEFLACAYTVVSGQSDHDAWTAQHRLRQALMALGQSSPELLGTVLRGHLESGNELRLLPRGLADHLLTCDGYEGTVTFLMASRFEHRDVWLTEVVCRAEPRTLGAFDILLDLYRRGSPGSLDPERIDGFREVDEAPLCRIVETLLGRSDDASYASRLLTGLFQPRGFALADAFSACPHVLSAAYLRAREVDRHLDYDGKSMLQVVAVDPGFPEKLVDWVFEDGRYSAHRDDIDLHWLWEADGGPEIADRLLEATWAKQRDGHYMAASFMNGVFSVSDQKLSEVARQSQDSLLREYITRASRSRDADRLRFIFEIVVELGRERLRDMLLHFLDISDDLALFEALPLEPRISSASGSWVPVLQRRVEFLQSLLAHLAGLDYLDHRYLVQGRIEQLQREIEREKKRDFIGHG